MLYTTMTNNTDFTTLNVGDPVYSYFTDGKHAVHTTKYHKVFKKGSDCAISDIAEDYANAILTNEGLLIVKSSTTSTSPYTYRVYDLFAISENTIAGTDKPIVPGITLATLTDSMKLDSHILDFSNGTFTPELLGYGYDSELNKYVYTYQANCDRIGNLYPDTDGFFKSSTKIDPQSVVYFRYRPYIYVDWQGPASALKVNVEWTTKENNITTSADLTSIGNKWYFYQQLNDNAYYKITISDSGTGYMIVR
jgi:hypothetical protein